MKDEITQKLIEYLEKTKDFALEQAPELLQQAIAYHYVSNVVWAISSAIGAIILSSLGIYFLLYPSIDKYESRDFPSIFIPVMSPILTFSCFMVFMCSIDTLLKISYAPKYFLLKLFI